MIITLEVAKEHLRKVDDAQDDLIMRELDMALGIVLDYLKVDADTYTDANGNDDLPNVIAAAVLAVLEIRFSGSPSDEVLNQSIKNVLYRQRDPALA